jgi:FKBP-type peptidyl-prolyl cis-trans isomerase FkpA
MKAVMVKLVAMVAVFSLLIQCDSPCTRTVSQSRINAVDQSRLQQDVETIDTYLSDQGITAIEDASGIRYTIDVQGTGNKPCLENSVTVMYKGKLLSNGTQFDASANPVSFPLSNLIVGWQIILPKIQAGSTVTLYIPSGFAYGPSQVGSIPANANLIFEIEFLK